MGPALGSAADALESAALTLHWIVCPALDSAAVLGNATPHWIGPLIGNLALDSVAVHLATTGRWALLGNLAVNDENILFNWDDPPSRDPITETENGFMEPKYLAEKLI